MHKLTTYHMEEKTICDIHGCKMTQVPCSMYVFCRECENAKYNTALELDQKLPS